MQTTERCEENLFSRPLSTTCMIIGVLNEGERITKQLEALQPYRNIIDIIIADGGSTDGATSPETLKDKVSAWLVVKGRGLSSQYHAAIQFALKAGYQSCIFMDGNGKDGVDGIPTFVAELQQGYDFLQGSRFMRGGTHKNTPALRWFAIRLVAAPLFWLACRFYYTDAMNGFKACSRRFLEHEKLGIGRDIFEGYTLQYYMNYAAPRLGMKIKEIPVRRSYPASGPLVSKIKGVRNYTRVLWQLLKVLAGRYNVR